MSSSSLSCSSLCSIIHVEDERVVDNLGRVGSYTGKLDVDTQRPHGKGQMRYSPDGDSDDTAVYQGQWVNGGWSGFGKLTSRDSCYEGSFLDNRKHGLGVMTYGTDGRTYDGSFQLGKMGKGRMTYPDGSIYWGYWSSEDLPHGRGKITKADGTVYDGEFEDGLIQGHGRMTYPDGRWYLGEFTDGHPNGLGLEVGSDGSLSHEGTFYNGAPVRCSSFPQRQNSVGSCIVYRTRGDSSSQALVGPLSKQISMPNILQRPQGFQAQ